jgi:GNAT superfamily N-acetyltransferase
LKQESLVQQVDVKVYYLEMLAAPAPARTAAPLSTRTPATPDPSQDVTILHVQTPSIPYYRFLYHAVGGDYHWRTRRMMSDEQLAKVIHVATNEVHVLHIDGSPAGFAELERGQSDEVELVQFGLMRDYIGRGLGKWFLQWAIDRVWSYRPNRFWLHTCSLDHPVALSNYQRAGFTLYKEETIQREL